MNSKPGVLAYIVCLAMPSVCLVAEPAAATEYWQVQSGDVTVIATGRKANAADTGTLVIRLQNAVRWMAGWPDEYHPSPVLVLALPDETIDRYFPRPKGRVGSPLHPQDDPFPERQVGDALSRRQDGTHNGPQARPQDGRQPGAQALPPPATLDPFTGSGQSTSKPPGVSELPDRPRTDHGLVISTPQASVLVVSASRSRGGKALDQLRLLYGRELLDHGLSAHWPECVRLGMSIAVAATKLGKPHQLYVSTTDVHFSVPEDLPALAPRETVNADVSTDDAMSRDRRAYGCYTLALMALHDKPLPRAPFTDYFRMLGEGIGFEEAAQSSFGISDSELSQHVRAFARGVQQRPLSYDVRAEVGGDEPAWPAPVPVSEERLHGILTSIIARMRASPRNAL